MAVNMFQHLTVHGVFLLLVLAARTAASQNINRPPAFVAGSGDMARFSLPENTPVGSSIYQLKGVDPEGSKIFYSISGPVFSVDRDTGVVKLRQELDRETDNIVEVIISITDESYGGAEPNTVSIRREIPVRDYNDNTPQFIGRPYRAIINESAKIGSEVVITPLIVVTDLDEGLNAECTISCTSPGSICDTFRIETIRSGPGNYTAKITLRKPLDFETQPSYVLTLTARDSAVTNKLSTQATISVNVIDVQDQVPVFINAPYSATIEENTAADVPVLTITAQDGDTSNPRPIMLQLQGEDKHHFTLMNGDSGSAVLTTTSIPLDREDPRILQNGGVYTFNVTATELIDKHTLGDTSVTQVTILLTDVEDNLPKFNHKDFHVTIPENLEKDTPLPGLMIIVNDVDLGENSKYDLSLRNVKNSENVFAITQTSGRGRTPVVVKVVNNEMLDFDGPDGNEKEFIFDIIASVHGTEVSSCRVAVLLEDVNDHAPVFPQSTMTVDVKEDVTIGTKILDIQATDMDSGRFSEISYVLKGFGSENFNTDLRNGGLYVKKKLDYEKQKSFSMALVAIDGGKRETNLNLFVNVIDVNDNYPMFDALEYTRTIREGATMFEPQFFVHASDIDGATQGGGRVHYTIDSENSISGHEFLINSETGEIKIANRVSSMDTERGQYELVVSARDYGEPPLSNNTRIVIRVGISGNQRPIFKNSNHYKPMDFPGPVSYKVSIPETASAGYNVTRISATDPDGIDALMEYRILGANDNFDINPHSGLLTVSTNSILDRDSISDHYNVVVIAVDAGFPFPETATATVVVSIADVNDEPPKFRQSSYETHISERTEIGSVVIQVQATDPDLNANLSYSIVEPITALSKAGLKLNMDSGIAYKQAMSIDERTGVIRLNRSINANTVSAIVLTVKVEDLNGEVNVAKQEATTEVTVYIQAFKDIDPVFKHSSWTSASPVINKIIKEEIPIGQTVMTLEAEDPETHEKISYFKVLENEWNILQLHEGTGELTMSQRLDYEMLPVPHFTVTVQAINLDNNRHSMAILNFTVENVNDNDPIFSSKVYKATISEAAKFPQQVTTVVAHDADKILTAIDAEKGYGNVSYTLLGQMTDYFLINRTTGDITIAPHRSLDREKYSVIKLHVQAEDAPNLPSEARKTVAEVIVTVSDINDNPPKFNQKTYSVVIPETVTQNSLVVNVTATDPDEGPGGDIQYEIFNEGEASGLLRIDPRTGFIYTKTELTGKGRSEPYEIVIRAQDQGHLLPNQESLYADVAVLVYIGDVSANDGVPFFIAPKLGQVTNITENSPPNTPIFQVIASDPDSSSTPSGMLHYRILNNTEEASLFSIDPMTGMIIARSQFDREMKSNYDIIIEVSDRGEPPLSVSRILRINILDVDDHVPHFERHVKDSPLQHSVAEEMPADTEIAIVAAVDQDEYANAEIDYVIVNGNQEGLFEIERLSNNTGLLKTNAKLDREHQETHLLTIKCFKRNTPRPRNKDFNSKDLTEIQVLVKVTDVDDHLPVFKPALADIGIRHNIAPDSLIYTVFADDDDPTANPISYAIVNISYTPQFYKRNLRTDTLENLFALNNETGELRTANLVQDFVDGYFSLAVSAQNSMDTRRHQNATLRVFIIRDKSLLRFVITKPPTEVRMSLGDLTENLQKKLEPTALELHLFNPEAHQKSDASLDFTATSVCFQLSRHGSAIPPQQMDKLLHQPDLLSQLTEVYVNYSVSAIEPCLAKRIVTAGSWMHSSGVWLVILAAMIGVIALIATCVSCCLFKSHKNVHSQLMSSTPPPPPQPLHHEAFMVSQPTLYGEHNYGIYN